MKKVITLLLILLMLVGCGKATRAKSEYGEDRFAIIETGWAYVIVADRETCVMYAVSNGMYNCGNFTLLVDKDGNPLIWEGE